MLKVTVASTTLREVPYTDKKGQPAKLLIQNAYLHTVDADGVLSAFPDKFEIVLPKGQTTPHALGEYTLHPAAISVDNNGRLACRPLLTQATPPAKR